MAERQPGFFMAMDHCETYIEAAVSAPPWNIYTYVVPQELCDQVEVGKRVLAPLASRTITAFVLSVKTEDADLDFDPRPILDVLDATPLFHESHIPFFKWISTYYLSPLGDVIKTALPGGLTVQDITRVHITENGLSAFGDPSFQGPERQILDLLNAGGPKSSSSLLRSADPPFRMSLLNAMARKGYVHLTRELKKGAAGRKFETWVRPVESDLSTDGLKDKHIALLIYIREQGPISLKHLKESAHFNPSRLAALEIRGFIRRFEQQVYRDPFGDSIVADIPPSLTDEQARVVTEISSVLSNGYSSYLLMGVTGSGKTEVYMQLVQKTLDLGRSALVLVPEISLISQTEKRFRMRFGDTIAVIHSGLTQGEKFDQWLRIAEKKVRIVIGARSAIFAPLENLGLVIVDEEHDASYKQENSLKYNARDLAVVRAKLSGAVSLLGSATPSLQSYYNTETGKFRELRLTKRVSDRPLPRIDLVDLKKYRDYPGIRSFITPPLEEAMARTLYHKEQILLFLNRRGYANYPVCATCGETMKCVSCDVSLTLHQSKNAYRCHMCGYMIPSNSKCRICNSSNIKNLGFGTERIEAAVKALFPEAAVARMDQDTTVRPGSMVRLLKDIKDRKTDILIGTQMIAKGHDFPGITLVGVISADQSLNFPDFRACERTFQLLAQVAGRAGRGDKPGLVIMQTYNPDHFSILAAEKQDFREFYGKEIKFRQSLGYPPFSRMIQFRITGKNRPAAQEAAEATGLWIRQHIDHHQPFYNAVEILGPIEAPIFKMADHYRWQILLKSSVQQPLHTLARHLVLESGGTLKREGVRITTDIDPYYLM
jgi:primosomal protein N' (replication factor Y)